MCSLVLYQSCFLFRSVYFSLLFELLFAQFSVFSSYYTFFEAVYVLFGLLLVKDTTNDILQSIWTLVKSVSMGFPLCLYFIINVHRKTVKTKY